MSYRRLKELDNQIENVAVGSKEFYTLIQEITEVVQGFCDAEATQGEDLDDVKIIWQEWEFRGEEVVIQAIESRLNLERYTIFVTEFEEYLDTELGREYYKQNPRGVSASYDLCRDNATDRRYVTLIMK